MLEFFVVKHPYIFLGSVIILGYTTYKIVKVACEKIKNVDYITINLHKKGTTTEEK